MSNLPELFKLARNENIRTTLPLTKRFMKWNRKMLREGKASFYADTEWFWNYATKKLRKKKYDRRYRDWTFKANQRAPHSYNSVLRLPNTNQNERVFHFPPIPFQEVPTIGGGTMRVYDEDGPRMSEWFLRRLLIENNIHGNWRVIMKHKFDIIPKPMGEGVHPASRPFIDYWETIPANPNAWYDQARL